MKAKLLFPVVALCLMIAGCGGEFPNEEMNISGAQKLRPVAVECDPPEAVPGESVTVSLYYYAPDFEAVVADWSVALDYRIGLYDVDEVEGQIVDAVPDDPVIDHIGGLVRQRLHFTIPEDVLLTSGAQPVVIEDEMILALARPLLGKSDQEPVTKQELNAYFVLRACDGSATPEEKWLADLFSCEIRFKIRLIDGIQVDVTRNLTVRYSRVMGSDNANTNSEFLYVKLLGIPVADVDAADVGLYEELMTEIVLYDRGATTIGRTIGVYDDWTYFLQTTYSYQSYTSPFDPVTQHEESNNTVWYHKDANDPASDAPLFVTDSGDEAEMGDLSTLVRLAPPTGSVSHKYQVTTVAYDWRDEWQGIYSTTKGVSLVMTQFTLIPAQ
jgi:hypothetical protein